MLAYSVVVGAFLAMVQKPQEIPSAASDSFSMNFTNTGLPANSNSEAPAVLTALNSENVTIGIQPILSVDHATVVRGTTSPDGLQIGTNSSSGKLTFTLKTAYYLSGFTLRALFGNTPGSITLQVTGVYETIPNLTTPSPIVRQITMGTTMADYIIDLSSPTSDHLIKQLTFEPNTTGNNTNFVIESLNGVDTSLNQTISFEQKVLSYSPCLTNNLAGVTVLDLAGATALRNEYVSLGANTKVKFERSKDDPAGAYQRYLFICSEFNLDPFNIPTA